MYAQGHREGNIVEDRLCVVEGHQIIVLDVSGSFYGTVDDLGSGGVSSKQILWCDLTQVEVCEGVGTEVDARAGDVGQCECVVCVCDAEI